ncbi:MAG: glycosyl hydrolase family 28 protein, partial [Brevinematia bacterium]
FDNCQGINIEGITSIHPRLMTTVLGGSQTAQVSWLHALSEMLSTDGVDIIGSSDVLIQNCFFATNDDCVALKAANWSYTPADGIGYCRHNVERVQVRGCTILNRGSGNALEIGHETSCDHINNVVFEDCDILAKHGYGAVFGVFGGKCVWYWFDIWYW